MGGKRDDVDLAVSDENPICGCFGLQPGWNDIRRLDQKKLSIRVTDSSSGVAKFRGYLQEDPYYKPLVLDVVADAA